MASAMAEGLGQGILVTSYKGRGSMAAILGQALGRAALVLGFTPANPPSAPQLVSIHGALSAGTSGVTVDLERLRSDLHGTATPATPATPTVKRRAGK